MKNSTKSLLNIYTHLTTSAWSQTASNIQIQMKGTKKIPEVAFVERVRTIGGR